MKKITCKREGCENESIPLQSHQKYCKDPECKKLRYIDRSLKKYPRRHCPYCGEILPRSASKCCHKKECTRQHKRMLDQKRRERDDAEFCTIPPIPPDNIKLKNLIAQEEILNPELYELVKDCKTYEEACLIRSKNSNNKRLFNSSLINIHTGA